MARQEIINNNLRDHVKPHSKVHWLRGINRNNTYEHEAAKLLQALKLVYYEGCDVALEVQLKSGGRPDVMVFDTPTPLAYEIMNSEEMASIDNKRKVYGAIKIVPIKLLS